VALKQDDDFARYVTIGAAGAAATLDSLNRRHGHRMVELERYATANKVWQRTLKRIRVPDLVCLDCGVRIEVRAKSKLAIQMSHSDSPGREWDAGLRDEDLAAFVAWDAEAEKAADRQHFFRIDAMRAARGYAKESARKAASEGSERSISWPARVPKRDGRVAVIDADAGTVRFEPVAGRAHTYRLPRGVPLHVYAREGDELRGGEDFLLGCLPRAGDVDCPGGAWDPVADLHAASANDRYVAVKACGLIACDAASESRLAEIAADSDEDERVRLEALGSLARLSASLYTERLAEHALRLAREPDRKSLQFAMESVLILSELRSEEAADALTEIAADETIHSEPRCAAVWGLGATGIDDSSRVLPFLADRDDEVALHALAGIGELDERDIDALARMLGSGRGREAASAAELLVHEAERGIPPLLEIAERDDRAGLWARVALGTASEAEVLRAADGKLPRDLAAALAPMWASRASWLQRQVDSPLAALRRQTIRHLG
jgi:hypothetical protein